MRLPKDPVFDVALLLADVREYRRKRHQGLQSSRVIAEEVGIPGSTVQLHLRPSYNPGMITADHAVRWMMWLGNYDVRIYEKEIDDQGEL